MVWLQLRSPSPDRHIVLCFWLGVLACAQIAPVLAKVKVAPLYDIVVSKSGKEIPLRYYYGDVCNMNSNHQMLSVTQP